MEAKSTEKECQLASAVCLLKSKDFIRLIRPREDWDSIMSLQLA